MTEAERLRIREVARKVAAEAPPLTDAQRTSLRFLLKPGRDTAQAA